MKLMRCPLNGLRNISEFRHGGEVVAHPDASACTDGQWADYVFMPENPAGLVREWWCHIASGYWFIAERNTVSDEIERTYPSEEWSGADPDAEPGVDRGADRGADPDAEPGADRGGNPTNGEPRK